MAGVPSPGAGDVGGTSAQGGGGSAAGGHSGSGVSGSSNMSGQQSSHTDDYYSRGFAQSADDIGTSSRSAGNTSTSGNDNQEMSALLRLMRSELSKQRADISDMMDEKIGMALEVAPQMKRTPADKERMKRQSYRNWADKYEAERQDELRAVGFTEREIQDIMQEDFLDSLKDYGVPPTILSQPAPRRWEWKVNDLGTFDGDPESFLTWSRHIKQLWDRKSDPHYREPLLDTIPLCLKGAARDWYNSLGAEEVLSFKSWEHYEDKLRKFFAFDDIALKESADSRKWDPRKETVSAYYFEKKKLLAGAYPNHLEKDLCHNIWMGLPSNFRLYCRTPMANNPTCLDLLIEMRKLEETWKTDHSGRKPQLPQSMKPLASKQEGSSSTTNNTVRSVKVEKVAGRRRPIKETYTSRNIFYKNNKRHYLIPDTDDILELQRPCSKCGGDHFDFEHDFILAQKNAGGKQVKQEAHFVEGYLAHKADEFDSSDLPPDETLIGSDESTLSLSPVSTRSMEIIDLLSDNDTSGN